MDNFLGTQKNRHWNKIKTFLLVKYINWAKLWYQSYFAMTKREKKKFKK